MLTACNVCHRLLVKPNENIIRRILDLLDKKPVPIPKGWRVCQTQNIPWHIWKLGSIITDLFYIVEMIVYSEEVNIKQLLTRKLTEA